MSRRELGRLIVQLDRLPANDLSGVLASLSVGERRQVERLLARSSEKPATKGSGQQLLSPALRERLSDASTVMTAHARAELAACLEGHSSEDVRDVGASLSSKLGTLFWR